MTRSVPTSLAGVTHYGDLGANFNQGGPSLRRLPRLCWRDLQPGMPQCTSLAEVVLARTSTGDAPVYVAWKCLSWVDDVRGGLAVLGKARGAGSHEDRSPFVGIHLNESNKEFKENCACCPSIQLATPTEVDEIHVLIGGMIVLVSPTIEGWGHALFVELSLSVFAVEGLDLLLGVPLG
ncbi:hypothetical protein CDL15_Pgr012291 [Punica granatum]|uniref:Uncharacterized protein n=1 Tax=Punica granatum TaxID=22663 RepID=A0A218WSZ1_PUNGR|nr:hypothetical protein CDL15_Pgr012291 [Punica granatum]